MRDTINTMRKKIIFEILLAIALVLIPTFFAYNYLANIKVFWNSQIIWSSILIVGWFIVALGYFNQGWLVHKSKNAKNVSFFLPIAVFFIQCVLFVKGIHYKDWSLVIGALVVNSGVVFNLYQIIKAKRLV